MGRRNFGELIEDILKKMQSIEESLVGKSISWLFPPAAKEIFNLTATRILVQIKVTDNT
jgi:hypothetical protein